MPRLPAKVDVLAVAADLESVFLRGDAGYLGVHLRRAWVLLQGARLQLG